VGLAGFGIAALALLVACGGDVGSGGTGAPATGMAVGTVNGFGSVFVDGVRFDDSRALALAETEPGKDVPAELRMGQRVGIEFDDAGVALAVRIDAALVGPVASVDGAGRFTVLGQTVSVNGNAAMGPVTQFSGGYTSASDVKAGDAVEVHGLLVSPGTVQATRIERRDVLPAYLKVSGTVAAFGTGGAASFKLGSLTVDAASAHVLPAGQGLANGQTVSVLGPLAGFTTDNQGTAHLQAEQVRVRQWAADTEQTYLSGRIAGLDAVKHVFAVDGVTVDYGAASFTPPATVPAEGMYVRVQGKLRADGSLAAQTVTLRDGETESEAELKGTIVGFTPGLKTFSIRDVQVDASAASVEGCPASGSWDGLYAEVEGSLQGTGVVAKEVHCEGEPAGGTVEREGRAGSVDLSAKTFVLSMSSATQPVAWTSTTYFGGLTPETLAGKRVEVQGVLSNGVLTATKVKLD
jgi:hypothetical protein